MGQEPESEYMVILYSEIVFRIAGHAFDDLFHRGRADIDVDPVVGQSRIEVLKLGSQGESSADSGIHPSASPCLFPEGPVGRSVRGGFTGKRPESGFRISGKESLEPQAAGAVIDCVVDAQGHVPETCAQVFEFRHVPEVFPAVHGGVVFGEASGEAADRDRILRPGHRNQHIRIRNYRAEDRFAFFRSKAELEVVQHIIDQGVGNISQYCRIVVVENGIRTAVGIVAGRR